MPAVPLIRRAFPGGVLAVGHRGSLVHLHAFGRLTCEADAPPVTTGTSYDLASLTKVVATTTMAMILVDEGKLDLDQPVQRPAVADAVVRALYPPERAGRQACQNPACPRPPVRSPAICFPTMTPASRE